MKWSEGHNWFAELPYSQIAEIPGQRFEFKFVVKRNEGGRYSVDRWEGGGGNHCFDGVQIKKNLESPPVKNYITQQLVMSAQAGKPDDAILIGSYTGQGDIHTSGSYEGHNIPNDAAKVELGYNKGKSALMFHQFWQDQ